MAFFWLKSKPKSTSGETSPAAIAEAPEKINAEKECRLELEREKKVAEEVQKEARSVNKELLSIINATPLAMFTLDHEGRVLDIWNPAAEMMFGYSADEVIGKPVPIVPDEFMDDFKNSIHEIFQGKFIKNAETRRKTKDGRLLFVNISKAPFYSEGGKISGIISIVMDITEQKKAEDDKKIALLRERFARREAVDGKRLLDALMENVPEGIVIAQAPDVTIKAVSNYGLEMVGRKRQDVLRTDFMDNPQRWQMFHLDGTPATIEELPLTRAVKKGEMITNEEWMIKNREGVPLTILCNAGPIKDKLDRVTGAVVLWRDITEYKKAQQALIESEKRFRLLFENTNDGVLMVTVGGEIKELNQAACEMLGYDCKELINKKRELIFDSSDPDFKEYLAEREKKGSVRKILTFTRKDGSRFKADVSSTVFKDLEGNPMASVIIRQMEQRGQKAA